MDDEDKKAKKFDPDLVCKEWKKPYLVFGFDMGIASLGWCVLDLANKRVVALNARLFDAPQNDKKKSLASERSAARRARRGIDRDRAIRAHCLAMLDELGLVEGLRRPDGTISVSKAGKLMQRKKGEPGVVELRAEALDRKLTDRELARILYWMSSHRGYIDHGRGGDKNDENGKVLKAISANARAMSAAGFATAGQYQASMLRDSGRFHNKAGYYSNCISNADYIDEIEKIFVAQTEFGSNAASDELKERFLRECLTYLTDTGAHDADIYRKVSPCLYFGDYSDERGDSGPSALSPRAAARCCPSFERCRSWETLNHIRIRTERGDERPLSRSTVETTMELLFSPTCPRKGAPPTWKALRRLEGMSAHESFKGIDSDRESKPAVDAPAWAALREALPAPLMERLAEDGVLADAVGSCLAYSFSRESLRSVLSGGAMDSKLPLAEAQRLDILSNEDIDAICAMDCTLNLYSGYGTRSGRALRMLCSEFEDGAEKLADAEKNLGFMKKRSEKRAASRLLGSYSDFDPTCSNPVVLRSTSQFRKVYNAMVREYGVPAEVHIELARELKLSKSDQAARNSANAARRKAREKFRELAAGKMGIPPEEVTERLLLKLDLLEQQGGRDAYTGEPIHMEDLIHDDRIAEVDHILPYSRSFDDSMANKVLVLAKSNQDKGQKTPYEWISSCKSGAPDWIEFCARVHEMNIPAGKKHRLTNKDFAAREESFVSRNLNDTRYMTRKVARWCDETLEFAPLPDGKKKHIFTPSGGATSLLRHCWGLGAKNRAADDMHHAVDAAIIAACTQGIVKEVADVHSSKHFVEPEAYKEKLAGSEPWEGFAREVIDEVPIAIPSRMAQRGITGPLFKDFTYRVDCKTEKGHLRISRRDASKGRVSKSSGNLKAMPDGGVSQLGGVAFLQLWWDPEGKARGRKTPGCWLADPVYYAEISAWLAGTRVPKFGKQGLPRSEWPSIPERALAHPPLRLAKGDAVRVKGQPRVYIEFDIGAYQWTLGFCEKSTEDATKGLQLSTCSFKDIKPLDMGPLGFPEGLENQR